MNHTTLNSAATHTLVCPQPPPEAQTASEAAALAFPGVPEYLTAFYERTELDRERFTFIKILGLEPNFWAHAIGPLGTPERPVVFVPSENQFRRYNPQTGLYESITTAKVTSRIMDCLDHCATFLPPRVQADSFFNLKNGKSLHAVVEKAREWLAVDESCWQEHKPFHIALNNGVLLLDGRVFHPAQPNRPVRGTLPVKYDPAAACPIFLNSFLAHILNPNDVDLLQRYCSQILEGINHSQTILVLTGDAGWGKSSLMKILGTLAGWKNVGIVREALFKDEFELAHYADKNFLFHPDMPTDFLDRKEASIFKQIVGGDPMWANTKGAEARLVLEGHYPVILACNGKPRIYLDQDTDAWLRRLVVLSFKTPSHEQHLGKLAEVILKTESSGILNWLLEGRAKLAKDKLQLTMTPEQKARAATLLLASDSPAAYVRSCLVKKPNAQLGVADLYDHYQEWCQDNHLRPLPSKVFGRVAREEIEITMGIKYRHDLPGENGKPKRGWRGLALVELPNGGSIKNASFRSGA